FFGDFVRVSNFLFVRRCFDEPGKGSRTDPKHIHPRSDVHQAKITRNSLFTSFEAQSYPVYFFRCFSSSVNYYFSVILFSTLPGYIVTEKVLHTFKIQRSEEHTSELQSRFDLVCRLLLEKKNIILLIITPCLTTHLITCLNRTPPSGSNC